MRITRLQLLLIVLVLIGIGFGGWTWYQKQISIPLVKRPQPTRIAQKPASVPSTPMAPSAKAPVSAARPVPATPISPVPSHADEQQKIARRVADVGEAYRRLAARLGPIPSIAEPLRVAKTALAQHQLTQANVAAQEASAAYHTYQNVHAGGTYQVARGDTLWKIAEQHTPVRHGAGWVGLWKANKKLVRNFDRIEVGWMLTIPERPSQYATRYWRPHGIARAAAKLSNEQLVDLRELPIAGDEIDVAELPIPEDTYGFAVAALRMPPAGLLPPVPYH